MKNRKFQFISLTILSLCILSIPQSLVLAANQSTCKRSTDELKSLTEPSNDQKASSRPVIFVHGWTGSSMNNTAKKIKEQLQEEITPFIFEYSKWASYWASNDHIAPCLADYVNKVSEQHKHVGGDGKVIIVSHSMGGLAIRYAMSEKSVMHPIKENTVSQVITLDTPFQGSPWGSIWFTTLLEVYKRVTGNHLPNPLGADGGRCLATHEGTDPLPDKCGELPPWLPKEVKLTQIAGDVTVDRKLFGINLYSFPLSSDGIVPVNSQHGYLNSGPDKKYPGKTHTELYTVPCRIDLGKLTESAIKNRDIWGGVTTFSLHTFFDSATLDDLLKDDLNSPFVRAYYGAATVLGDCSHIKITNNENAINRTTEVIKNALDDYNPLPRISANTCTGQAYSFIPPNGYSINKVTDDKFANYFNYIKDERCPYFELVKEENNEYYNITINRLTHSDKPGFLPYPDSIIPEKITVAGFSGEYFFHSYNDNLSSTELQEYNSSYKSPTRHQGVPEYFTWSEGERRIFDLSMARGSLKGIKASVHTKENSSIYPYESRNPSLKNVEFPVFVFRTSSLNEKYLKDFKDLLGSVEFSR